MTTPTAPLADWGNYYTPGGDSINQSFQTPDAQALAFLKQIQAYDPNAKWVESTPSGGSDSGNNLGSGQPVWQLQSDLSKLPRMGVSMPGATTQGGNPFGDMADFGNSASAGTMNDPSKAIIDSIYGKVTSPSNVHEGFDVLGTIGPLIVGGAMGGLGEALATGLTDEAGFAAVSAGDLFGNAGPIGNLLKGAPQALGGLLDGKGGGGIGGLIGSAASSLTGVPGGSLVGTILGSLADPADAPTGTAPNGAAATPPGSAGGKEQDVDDEILRSILADAPGMGGSDSIVQAILQSLG